ncbi:MAG: hypothetical protein ABIQ61_02330 [Ornithinibacter sp.]
MSTEHALPPAVTVGWRSPAAALLTATSAALWILRGSWGRGEYLFRDFVAVPTPVRPAGVVPMDAAALRGWPLDAVSWLFSALVAPGIQQAFMLAACLILAGTGAGLLVARAGPAAAATASGIAVWNPYVTERLLLGQPPTLLAYACLPWIVMVARSRHPRGRRIVLLVVAAAPAALIPWGGAVAAASAILATASRRECRWSDMIAAALAGLAWCLPWLVPTLIIGGVTGDADGARAFGLADDTGFGLLLSALHGGGVWASGAQPPSRGDPLAVLGSTLILVAALLGVGIVWRTHGRRLGVVSGVLLLGPAVLGALASGPALNGVTDLQSVPGFALLRDQHRLLMPGVMATALLIAVGVGQVTRVAGPGVAAAASVVALSLAVTSVPDLPRVVQEAYQPIGYPADWYDVVDEVNTSPASTTVLSLPWQPLRQPRWAPERPFLDPLPRALRGRVLTSTSLPVRRDGTVLLVDDSPQPAGEQWRRGQVDGSSLRSAGVTHVLEWRGTPGALPVVHSGWVLVFDGANYRLWDVSRAE